MEFLEALPEAVQLSIYVVFSLISLLGLWKVQELVRSRFKDDDAIHSGIQEWLTIAIITAYRTSDQSLDEFGHMLTNADRKAIADHIYEYLPDLIQSAMPRESWTVYVQNHYDNLLNFWWQWHDEFGELAKERLEKRSLEDRIDL